MIKTYQHKPITMEAIQFDGENFNEIIEFIGDIPYYTSNVNGKLHNIGLTSDDEIFWFKRNCWVSKQGGVCYPHENSFENWLRRNCVELEQK